jgi:ABC-2 type transport system ATP-binding protein
VIIIYKGRIMADDSVGNLRSLMSLPTLEDIFGELVQQQDMETVARDIVEVMQGQR